jgi:hypothetical protein
VTDQIFVGVDVAKDWLDIHHASHGPIRINNSPLAARSFAARCAKEGAWVVFEASGGYDHQLRDALESAQVRFSRINPRQARDFAKAIGVIGKTDRVDARMLTELGARLTPAPTQPLPPERRALQAQATRRRQLVEMRKHLQPVTGSVSDRDSSSRVFCSSESNPPAASSTCSSNRRRAPEVSRVSSASAGHSILRSENQAISRSVIAPRARPRGHSSSAAKAEPAYQPIDPLA